MGERKVINKYFPPDFDPTKIPRSKKAQLNPNFVVRMMLPMSVRCQTCGEYMYKGKKFNSRKEDVEGPDGEYLGIKIFRFYFKCVTCSAEFTIKTDPKNMDYEVEGGVSRNYEAHKDVAEQKKEQIEAREKSDADDAMSRLENKTKDSKIEMDILEALDEIKSQNARNSRATIDSVIEKHRAATEAQGRAKAHTDLDDADEAAVEAAFAQGRVKRLREDEPDGAASTSQPRAGARAAGSGGATSLLAAGSATAEKAVSKRPRLPPGLVVQAKPAVAAKGAAAAPAAAAVGAASSSSNASPAAPAPTALLGLGDYDSSGSGSGSKSD